MTNSDTHAPQFFPPLEPLSPREIAGALGREVSGDTAAVESPIVGVSPLEAAEAGHLSFLDNPRYAEHLSGSLASCVILGPKFADHAPDHLAVIVSPEPYRDFARAAAMLVPASVNLRGLALTDGVSDGAHIHSDAVLEDGV
ncbi:MAG: UDP-3-O-(3-hydroxymyristoyl)glucosamine N-acyltransferase, partial [Devosiaceae bacterium]|nr:UDP-3-O-(3-hydroxymyristoyl)glucosamine N-acyltransferase [Devosiaceae bacterium MH13]